MENNENNIPEKYDWSDKKVLIAEDEVMNYLYLEEALRETGITVVWCKNGHDAVEKITIDKVKFDIILMDIKMPKMNGYDATEIIKKYNPDIPVIIQTAFAMPEERKKGFEVGGCEYLEKPIRQNTLLTVLNKFIK
ncbi:MAG: response regulator [Bacteroidales bacterium]|nr:response regulator [Bacteroidales bacterium]